MCSCRLQCRIYQHVCPCTPVFLPVQGQRIDLTSFVSSGSFSITHRQGVTLHGTIKEGNCSLVLVLPEAAGKVAGSSSAVAARGHAGSTKKPLFVQLGEI